MKDVSYDDLVTMFKDTVILYEGRPCKVLAISADKRFMLLDLETQKQLMVEWDFKKFRNPARRLGMVNLNDGAVYVSRIPVRKYWAGLHRNNLQIQQITGDRHSKFQVCYQEMQQLTAVGIADSLNNAYPSFHTAKEWVKTFYGTYAFDKQFALDTDGQVFYKTLPVGHWNKFTKSEKDIEFHHGYDHLKFLLDPTLTLNRAH